MLESLLWPRVLSWKSLKICVTGKSHSHGGHLTLEVEGKFLSSPVRCHRLLDMSSYLKMQISTSSSNCFSSPQIIIRLGLESLLGMLRYNFRIRNLCPTGLS